MVAIITDPDHAGIVKKMRQELDTNLGQEPMRLSEKHKIPYCEAVRSFKNDREVATFSSHSTLKALVRRWPDSVYLCDILS